MSEYHIDYNYYKDFLQFNNTNAKICEDECLPIFHAKTIKLLNGLR